MGKSISDYFLFLEKNIEEINGGVEIMGKGNADLEKNGWF